MTAPPTPRLCLAVAAVTVQRRSWVAGALVSLLTATGCAPPAASGWAGYAEGEYVYLSAPLGGTLTQLAVKRGDGVKQGTLLASLDADNEHAAAAEAVARLANAKAAASNLDSGKRAQELAVLAAQAAQARSQAALAQAELKRQEQLVAQGFISPSHLDAVREAAAQAQAKVQELQAALGVAQLPARSDERAAASASREAAGYAVAQAHWREGQKQLQAPQDAQVADTYFRAGEWVAPGQPVLALLPPGAIKVRFFVPESELAQLTVGQAVAVGCDGCAAPVKGQVSFIATQAEYTPPVIYSNSQRARLVFMVEARVAASSPLHPGQPVDVHRASPP